MQVYCASESLVLTAGRDVPGVSEVKRRGDGVTTLLLDEAVRTWSDGGSRQKA